MKEKLNAGTQIFKLVRRGQCTNIV